MAANAAPFNRREGTRSVPSRLLHFSGDTVECRIADSIFVMVPGQSFFAPLVINGEPQISFRKEDEHLLLSLVLYDDDGVPLLSIIDNEMTHSVAAWDVSVVGTTLTIREAASARKIRIKFSPPNRVHISHGVFRRAGFKIWVGEDFLIDSGSLTTIRSCGFHGMTNGIAFGEPSPSGSIGISCRGPSLPSKSWNEVKAYVAAKKKSRPAKNTRLMPPSVQMTEMERWICERAANVAWDLIRRG